MATTVRAYDVAAMFLQSLGAPVTPTMQRAVAIWLRFESGGTITGNNPWNLHSGPPCVPGAPHYQNGFCPLAGNLPGQIGNRYAGPGDKNVAVFSTLNAGANASAQNLIKLSNSGFGYDKVIAAARSGNALGFLVAIQNSAWSAGHYSHSKLVGAFRGLFNYNTVLTLNSGGAPISTGDPGTDYLGAWGNIVSFPIGHVITTADVDTIMTALTNAHFFDGDSLFGGTKTEVRDVLNGIVGREWNKALQDELQAKFFKSAVDAGDPLTKIANAIGGIAGIFGFLLDPQNWLYIIALSGGFVMAGYGFAKLSGANIGAPSLRGGGDSGDDGIPVVDDLTPVTPVSIVRKVGEAA